MKKIILALIVMAMAASCQKENANNLKGTKWETTGFAMIDAIWGYKYHVYDFYSKDKASSYWLDRNGKMTSSDGDVTYKVESPYVYITKEDGDVVTLEMIDRMSMVVTTNTSIKYYKQ
jgi:hypothetical protein